MPIATIHVHEGRYDEGRLRKVSGAIQDALIRILKVPPDDFYQIIHVSRAAASCTRRRFWG